MHLAVRQLTMAYSDCGTAPSKPWQTRSPWTLFRFRAYRVYRVYRRVYRVYGVCRVFWVCRAYSVYRVYRRSQAHKKPGDLKHATCFSLGFWARCARNSMAKPTTRELGRHGLVLKHPLKPTFSAHAITFRLKI